MQVHRTSYQRRRIDSDLTSSDALVIHLCQGDAGVGEEGEGKRKRMCPDM